MAGRQIGAALVVLVLAALAYASVCMLPAEVVSVAAERIERAVTLQALCGTAVQMDVCDSASAARISAGRLQCRGSAGYVHFDGGYRVLGALMETRADAERMCEKLNANGMSVECYDCDGQALTLKVSGEERHIRSLEAAIHALDMAAVQPERIAQQLDASQIDCDRARALAAMLVSDLETAQADFGDTGAEGVLPEKMDRLMASALAWLEPLTQADACSEWMLAGEMRCAGMAVRFGREAMIRQLAQKAD